MPGPPRRASGAGGAVEVMWPGRRVGPMDGGENGWRGEFSRTILAGVVDVPPLGPTRAVATFPFVINVQTQQGLQQLKGAMTLVLEKTGTKWLIIHDHISLESPPAAVAGWHNRGGP